jgi:tetratricopeptide (TPR) repeat protein
MIIDADGTDYDWFVGYGPPPEKFQAKLEKSLSGEGTFKALSAAYAKDPKDVSTVFNLAQKYADRYDTAKAQEKYKEVISLDPEGQAGTYTTEYTKISVPYTQYAEFAIATENIYSDKPDLEPVRAFIKKYPDSKLVKEAYGRMAGYYSYSATKEEASKFFEEYTAKYPNDARALDTWLARIVKDKEPLDKGAALVERIEELTRDNPVPDMNQDIANYYFLKGDKEKTDKIYGQEFMDGKVSMFAYDLVSYANFWLEKNANLDSAVAMAEIALKLQPENLYILQQVANAYVKTNKEDKALALFGPDYIQKKPGDASTLTSYAAFWARQGKNLDSALAAAKKAVELKPGTLYFWTNLSDVYLKMKNYPEALKAAEKALALAEDDYSKKHAQQRIDKINSAQAGEKK